MDQVDLSATGEQPQLSLDARFEAEDRFEGGSFFLAASVKFWGGNKITEAKPRWQSNMPDKMRVIGSVIVVLAALFVAAPVWANEAQLVHVMRFTDYEWGSVEDWLQGKGFQLKEDMRRSDRIDVGVGEKGLLLEAKRRAFGFMPNESLNIPKFTHVEIDWGVNKFPEGASYEQGVRNEAIVVYMSIGDERQPSGSLFVPDSPYFVALFLCHGDDRINYPYVGSYFKKGGRFVCGDRPAEGQLVTSRFDLLEAYRTYFGKERDDDPAISGLALALDTKKAGDGGRSSAFLREIRFYR